MKSIVKVFLTLITAFSINSYAYDWQAEGKIVLVQPSYMPNIVSFQIDEGAGSCIARSWLKWEAKGNTDPEKHANANAVYSTLLAAFMSGKSVRVYGNNENCLVEFVHLF